MINGIGIAKSATEQQASKDELRHGLCLYNKNDGYTVLIMLRRIKKHWIWRAPYGMLVVGWALAQQFKSFSGHSKGI